jgi:hypothetical protein
VFVFLAKVIWHQARYSILDTKFGCTNSATQQTVDNSSADGSAFLGKRQFTIIDVAA